MELDMDYVKAKRKEKNPEKQPPCGVGSWIKFWEMSAKRSAHGCLTLGCYNFANVGGLMIIAGDEPKEYILPICYSCNNALDDQVFIVAKDDLIQVNPLV